MSLHPDDLQAFTTASGGKPIPSELETEYDLWLQLKHRMKHSGPLGILMVPLMRMFGVEPPAIAVNGTHVNWRTVARGRTVIVAMDGGGVARGEFKGIANQGAIQVKFPNADWVQEFPPFKLTLDEDPLLAADRAQAAQRPPNRPVTQQINPYIPPISGNGASSHAPAGENGQFAEGQRTTTGNDLPRLDPDQHNPTPKAKPKMGDSRWHLFGEGKELPVIRDGEELTVGFVRIGPADHQFVGIVDGGDGMEDVFDESMAQLPARKPKSPPKKKKGKSKGKPPRAPAKKPAYQAEAEPALA